MKSFLKISFISVAAITMQVSLYSISHYYDAVGRLVQTAYPQGSGIHYVYDDNDNLLSATTINVPPPPENLLTTTNEDSGINLSWEATNGADNYRIFRRQGSNLAWAEVTTVPFGTIMFIDTSTLPGTEYVYRLVATSDSGLSAYSEPSSAISQELNVFSARVLQSTSSTDLYEIKFPGESGSNYRVEFSETLQNSDWNLQAYRQSPTGADSQELVSGVEDEMTIYLEIDQSELPRFFRIIKDPD